MGRLHKAGLVTMLFPGVFIFVFLFFLPIYHELSGVLAYHYPFNLTKLFSNAVVPTLEFGGPFLLITGITWRWCRIGSVIAIVLSLLILIFFVHPFLNPEYFYIMYGATGLFLAIVFLIGAVLVIISEKRLGTENRP